MLLGAGAVGLVLETAVGYAKRLGPGRALADQSAAAAAAVQPSAKARLVATQYSNSAYHGAAMDRKHIGAELVKFLTRLEAHHGITPDMIAKRGVYLSHETCTHASPSSSCAANEASF